VEIQGTSYLFLLPNNFLDSNVLAGFVFMKSGSFGGGEIPLFLTVILLIP